ncbi:YeeE/YedE family protein [Aquimarina agarilytica]|uniref:YeeE/YedE family protein n=1 Tax=Aquimarina agarilytica TaxID=1087449 RepID=UPI000287FF4E|nr:YeeE/YedE thiosulfate transporter family protein [Aquimarina agarilytica]
MNWIYNPWPWYVSGPMIAFVMFLLLMTGKKFGMSSNLRTLCTLCGAGKKTAFFKFDWKSQKWNLLVAVGTIIGATIAANWLTIDDSVHISQNTIDSLTKLGFNDAGKAYVPQQLFDLTVATPKNLLFLFIGGLLVGFGARYAGGCTSGHAISGLSNLQLPSLIAVIGFFIGGLIMIYLLFPLLF